MRCEQCGSIAQGDELFCSDCGAKLKPAPKGPLVRGKAPSLLSRAEMRGTIPEATNFSRTALELNRLVARITTNRTKR